MMINQINNWNLVIFLMAIGFLFLRNGAFANRHNNNARVQFISPISVNLGFISPFYDDSAEIERHRYYGETPRQKMLQKEQQQNYQKIQKSEEEKRLLLMNTYGEKSLLKAHDVKSSPSEAIRDNAGRRIESETQEPRIPSKSYTANV